jgi:hypothetical protein
MLGTFDRYQMEGRLDPGLELALHVGVALHRERTSNEIEVPHVADGLRDEPGGRGVIARHRAAQFVGVTNKIGRTL